MDRHKKLRNIAKFVMRDYDEPGKSIYRHHHPYLYLNLQYVRELCLLDHFLLKKADKLQYDLADVDDPLWDELSDEQKVDFIMGHLTDLGVPDTDEDLLQARYKFVEDNVEKPCQALTLALMDHGYITISSNAFSADRTKGVIFSRKEDLYLGPEKKAIGRDLGYEGLVRQIETFHECFAMLKGTVVGVKKGVSEPVPLSLSFDIAQFLPSPTDFEGAPIQPDPPMWYGGKIEYLSVEGQPCPVRYNPH